MRSLLSVPKTHVNPDDTMTEKPGIIEWKDGPYWRRWLMPRISTSAVVLVVASMWWCAWQVFRLAVHLASR